MYFCVLVAIWKINSGCILSWWPSLYLSCSHLYLLSISSLPSSILNSHISLSQVSTNREPSLNLDHHFYHHHWSHCCSWDHCGFLRFSLCNFFLFSFFIGYIGDWAQGLVLVRSALYHLSYAPNPFTFSLFFK
jgi:hypothetical protein